MMKYTLTPKQGDTVRVRHPKKGLCDAIYSHRAFDKDHCVECDKEFCVASFYTHYEIGRFTRVRFVYPLSLMPKPEVREQIRFLRGDKVLYKGYKHTVYDVDEGYDYLALDGDKYICPNHEDNRCISAPMSECKLIAFAEISERAE